MTEQLLGFAERLIGPCRLEEEHSWPHGGSRVLRLRDVAEREWFVKAHAYRTWFLRELTAYRRWVLDGYGRSPDEQELAFMRASFAGTAVWMVVWAQAHGESAFTAGLRESLHGLRNRA